MSGVCCKEGQAEASIAGRFRAPACCVSCWGDVPVMGSFQGEAWGAGGGRKDAGRKSQRQRWCGALLGFANGSRCSELLAGGVSHLVRRGLTKDLGPRGMKEG